MAKPPSQEQLQLRLARLRESSSPQTTLVPPLPRYGPTAPLPNVPNPSPTKPGPPQPTSGADGPWKILEEFWWDFFAE